MPGLGAACIGAVLCLAVNVQPLAADVAAITSQNADRLTLIDTDRLQVVASVALPGKPAAVAVDGGRNRVLAVATETARLHVFDLGGTQLAVWPLSGAPFGVAVRPEDGAALISDQNGHLRAIDPVTGQELQVWQVGAMPSGVAAMDGLIALANRDDDSVTVITADAQHRIGVGHHPFGITLLQGRAFVTDVLADQVSVIDLRQLQVIATIPTGERPYAVAFAAGKGFVTNQYDASLTVFDTATLEPVGRIETDEYPEGIASTADGRRILVANWFSDTVQVIDPETLEVLASIDVPAGPRAFGSFIAASPADGPAAD